LENCIIIILCNVNRTLGLEWEGVVFVCVVWVGGCDGVSVECVYVHMTSGFSLVLVVWIENNVVGVLLYSCRLSLRLSRNVGKSKSFQEQQRRKIEKWEAQVKDLQEGGSLDSDPSRRAKLKGRIEGGLKGM